jgi:hypothetical protein
MNKMLKTMILSVALSAALMSGMAPAQAAPPTVPPSAAAQPYPMNPAERAQLAAEAGMTPKQAAGLSLTQLAELKSARDGDDGAYALAPGMRDATRL